MGFEDFSFLSCPEFGFLKALAWELWLGILRLGEPEDRYWGNRRVRGTDTASLRIEQEPSELGK